jgi:hypothetical protein
MVRGLKLDIWADTVVSEMHAGLEILRAWIKRQFG